MIFFPAIDLKAGQCVRLVHGDMEQATVFNDDPAAQARAFADAGCTWLHMVDLDGAFAGKPENAEAVSAVLDAVDIKVQLGGGIRDMNTIEGWLARGLARVILGTVAVRDPALVIDACKAFPGHVALGIDARDGYVAVQGWAEATELKTEELAKRFEDAGAAALIFTDIGRDGAMQGPNLDATLALADAVDIPVILSGGVSSMDDLEAVRERGGKLAGVISGRAVYDGRIDPAEAVQLLAEAA
ncbi:MAG: 1-(5-phosphoribosyl)-5-[(5-phosphoribosylamino)methylideneamino]imidazole-4-carboxamide isomerase [Rhodospirillales bacterium]|nr:1-(5-phosphoribosyl)-5-[(5-phosphoribosylamino)methylideneamino]imidazole-4-carboxamide isomerase [Rhodospirillales bacterium]MBO6787606.1 1-(5-phosphoribosyl)-5-[(5-phosphoribosylamino)methylideneamino]imidazole-4-carboxamide isomerase [Rhodospirillales bacterium]